MKQGGFSAGGAQRALPGPSGALPGLRLSEQGGHLVGLCSFGGGSVLSYPTSLQKTGCVYSHK